MSEEGDRVTALPKEGAKEGEKEKAEPSAQRLAEASPDAGECDRKTPQGNSTTSKTATTSKNAATSETSLTSKSGVDNGGRRHLSEVLRREVCQHEQRLEAVFQRLQHAAQHLNALGQVSEKLRRVIDVEKKKSEDHITLKEAQQEEGKDEGPRTSSSQCRRGGKRTCSDMVTISLEQYRDFLAGTESLAEGILLLQAEGGIGDIARELRGAPMEEDLARWRRLVALLVKYDDHVRRAIDCFDRQVGQTKMEEEEQ